MYPYHNKIKQRIHNGELVGFEFVEDWWLATAHSTSKHDGDLWVKCVSPRGSVGDGHCGRDISGVRPFCIFKSSIFVS